MLVVLWPALATSGHEIVIPWRGRECVTGLGARFHPRFMKKKCVMFLLKAKKHCTPATGIIQCSSVWDLTICDHEPQNYWILLKTALGLWPTAAVILTACLTLQCEEIFPSIDLKFICNLLQWSTLIFLFPLGKQWVKKKRNGCSGFIYVLCNHKYLHSVSLLQAKQSNTAISYARPTSALIVVSGQNSYGFHGEQE